MAARAVIPGSGVVAGEFDVSGLVLAYPHRLGGHCGSGAQRDLLAWAGLGWNGPPSEGLTFTLSGALDFSYLRSSELRPPLYLVGRGSDLETDLPTRLGATVDARSTDDPELGWKWVTNEIDSGRPVMAWADIAELPYLRVKLRMSRHDIVVIGYDDDAEIAHVVDNDREQTQLVPYAALARARASTSFPVPTRHTTFLIEWPEGLPPLRNVAADAFRQIASTMADPVVSRGGARPVRPPDCRECVRSPRISIDGGPPSARGLSTRFCATSRLSSRRPAPAAGFSAGCSPKDASRSPLRSAAPRFCSPQVRREPVLSCGLRLRPKQCGPIWTPRSAYTPSAGSRTASSTRRPTFVVRSRWRPLPSIGRPRFAEVHSDSGM